MREHFKHHFRVKSFEKQNQLQRVRYELTFASLIPPFISNETRFTLAPVADYTKKILMKKSYLILTWFYYLSNTKSRSLKESPARLAILPSKNKKYTLTKAPMAHKTNSKEQFQFKFYFYKMSVTTRLPGSDSLSSVYLGGFFGANAKKNFPFFETNLMFVKSATLKFEYRDRKYFSYYSFLRTSNRN